ncbi:18416_t:CDS:2 [Gigaspora margarita]|uniref:18416_t:CDS:1 n=1 Tax=Gigaspora margarita TaxID=4874 RepID=A0ABN7V2M6_GIGMA|nr:18416_t:CDS:2 [Gigaspora margarita]
MSNHILAMIVLLGKRLKTKNSIITILDDSVEKRVSVKYLLFARNLDDCINFLSKLYEYAKEHTGIAQVKENCKYVLIDFEHANVNRLVTSKLLKDWNNKTLTKYNEYTIQSDLYQFEKMLRNFNIVNSEARKNFLDSLRDKSISIENVLLHEWFG